MAKRVARMTLIVKVDYTGTSPAYTTSIVQYTVDDPTDDLTKESNLTDMDQEIDTPTLDGTFRAYISGQEAACEQQEDI